MLSIICIIQLFLASHGNAYLPEDRMSSTDLILNSGYPAQAFTAETKDGYLLQMHRIPYGKNEIWNGKAGVQKKPVVFLQHGLLGSSADWVINLPDESFAFMLADAGFDVWMGNSRGNSYTSHRNHSTSTEEFWRFTWDEMTHFDLDAMIDFVLTATDEKSLHYVGFSQGTLQMFAKLSLKSESFNKKIRQFFALAPVATVGHIRGLLRFLSTKIFKYKLPRYLVGKKEFLVDVQVIKLLGVIACGIESVNPLCLNVLGLIAGPESDQLNKTRMTVYMGHTPAGTSTMNMFHWIQMVNSGMIQEYDYESAELNMEHYGQADPPLYNISNIDVPTYLYWSDTDWLANQEDINQSLLTVLDEDVLKESNRLKRFNHLDFIWGLRAASEVYTPIIKSIRKYVATHQQFD